MFRLVWRSAVGRFGRILLTALAIIASTAFLGGTLVFDATVGRAFDAIISRTYAGVDAYVQSGDSVETALGFEVRAKVPARALAAVRAVPGVADAQVYVQGDAVVIAKNGKPIERISRTTNGGTINSGALSVWKISTGRAPTGPHEVVLDEATAQDGRYQLGDAVKVNAEGGSRSFTLVGVVVDDDVATPGNATWALFDADTAMEFIAKPGFADALVVRGDGSLSDEVLAARVQQALVTADPVTHYDTLSGAQIVKQSQTDIDRSLSLLTIFLSVFSFIALAVGCFVIYNVFSITAAQRRREHALLRAIGASRAQVTRMMLGEAAVVGLVGSLLGLVGGIGLAALIRVLLDQAGFGIPARRLVITPTAVVVTLVAGLLTTVVAALAPALMAGRVSPVAALAGAATEQRPRVRLRIAVSVLCGVVGAALIVAVVAGADSVFLGIAVVVVMVGVLLAGPVMANPIARVLGAPVERLRGVTGTMARGNVQRNPTRTARTAAPVLIGVALVTGTAVFASSIKEQLRDTVGKQFLGQYVINSTNGGALSFSQTFVDEVNALPEVGAATGLGFALLKDTATGSAMFATTVNPATAQGLLDYHFITGSFADLTPRGILISSGEATRSKLAVGSSMSVDVGGTPAVLTVQGIYASSELAQARVVDRQLLAGTTARNPAGFIFLTRAPGVSDDALRRAVNESIAGYGIGELQDRDQFIDGRGTIIDRTLGFIYGLLALSVLIAAFGIVLTMLLAVYERRRETGLLRAVGMSRAQVRATVRWESVLTSLYGAVAGVLVGLLLGDVIIVALHDQGLSRYAVPWGPIGVIMATAFVVGVLAAVVPARRATRLGILRAIAADG